MIGKMVAMCAMENGKEVCWLPAYGPQMRGGTASCGVNISDDPIDAPQVTSPTTAIVLNTPAFKKYVDAVAPGGRLIMNSSMIEEEPIRTDITVYKVPFNKLAHEGGNERAMNMLVSGYYVGVSGEIAMDGLYAAIEHAFEGPKEKFIEGNQKMASLGYEYAKKSLLK